MNKNKEQTEPRIIKTARTEKAINKAAEQGFRPLIKPVIPSPDIRSKFAVLQDKETGKITVAYDYRQADIPFIKPVVEFPKETQEETDSFNLTFPHVANTEPTAKQVTVIGWTYYYPYNFKSPYAAYLVPLDLKVGETVMLEDLIEDIVGERWSQGDTYRLKSCKAVWDGKEFILQHDPYVVMEIVG
jgi:hypothetical protein